MNNSPLNQLLVKLQQLLAGFGVPEESLPVAALIVLYLAATVAVLAFVFLLWRISRRRPPQSGPDSAPVEPGPAERDVEPAVARPPEASGSVLDRMRTGLGKTRDSLVGRLDSLFAGKSGFSRELLDELEEILITSDFGMPTTMALVETLEERFSGSGASSQEIYDGLKQEISKSLKQAAAAEPEEVDGPRVVMVVGVNGVGKTTTIGKLAKKLQEQGHTVMLAAGDTFRAAAVEQLQIWGERNRIPVVAQQSGADPASVIYDAVEAARARGTDVLIADTAGRLHTKSNLMEELRKIKRVVGKLDSGAPHEVMLVIDACTGQNALSQALQFHEGVGLTGITLTKLDGTAKGGIIFAIAQSTGLPIRYIGVGEAIEDLREFDAEEFVDALFDPQTGVQPLERPVDA